MIFLDLVLFLPVPILVLDMIKSILRVFMEAGLGIACQWCWASEQRMGREEDGGSKQLFFNLVLSTGICRRDAHTGRDCEI